MDIERTTLCVKIKPLRFRAGLRKPKDLRPGADIAE
jgi:hypothetical protein